MNDKDKIFIIRFDDKIEILIDLCKKEVLKSCR